jgi:hypothetical protein
MDGSLVADVTAVSMFESAQDQRRKHGEDTKEEEGAADAVNHGIGVRSAAGAIRSNRRISNTARSGAWIATEYNNQSSPSTFYSFTP